MDFKEKKVSVLIPCRNEVEAIENCLRNVFSFEAPEGGFEVIIIDGMSDDGTRDIILQKKKDYPDLILIDNPDRTIPHAMNLGIQKSRAEYIIRTDVRCVHPENYLCELIELSEQSNADNVGAVLEPEGKTYVQKSIATAYKSPLSMGSALRDRGDFTGETDAVYGGCFKRDRLLEIGMYDEEMIKNEDDELSFRLREKGGKVIQTGRVKVKYFPRKNFLHLFKQFMQYGYWKVPVLKKHPTQASLRHLAPTSLVVGFLVLAFAAIFNQYARVGLGLCVISYFLILCLESVRLSYKKDMKLFPLIAFSMAIIHIGYGVGFLIGIFCSLFNVKPKWFETLTR